jgi:hypothetical protein
MPLLLVFGRRRDLNWLHEQRGTAFAGLLARARTIGELAQTRQAPDYAIQESKTFLQTGGYP